MRQPPFQPLSIKVQTAVQARKVLQMIKVLRRKMKQIWFDQHQQQHMRFLHQCLGACAKTAGAQCMWKVDNLESGRRLIQKVIFAQVWDNEFDFEPYLQLAPWIQGCVVGVKMRAEGWSYENTAWCLLHQIYGEKTWKLKQYQWNCWLSPRLMDRLEAKSSGKKDIRHFMQADPAGYTVTRLQSPQKRVGKKVSIVNAKKKSKREKELF